MSLWTDANGNLLCDANGALIDCDECPCGATGCPEGSSLYKIKYAEKDTGCTPGSGNEYRLNISCSCVCLISGAVPDPLPEGKTAADYVTSYPMYGQTGEEPNIVYWKRSIVGGPFADDVPLGRTAQEKCDAFQVEGCTTIGTCGWYKIRKAYYDAACLDIAGGYNDDVTCECRCLINSAVPNPIPEGKTAEDYTGYYASVDLEYRYDLFGPYEATCDQSADQICAATKIEGCDYAWGCSWNGAPRMWYGIKLTYYTDECITEQYHITYPTCLTADELANNNPPIDGTCTPGQPAGYYFKWTLYGGPEWRRCDINTA